jgi:serine/threonine protein kinase
MVQIGDLVNDRWKIVEKLPNVSGQGETYLAEDQLFSRPVGKRYVIKLLKIQDEKAVARFAKEIKSCISLQHPNIVKVVDSEYEGTLNPYLVTDYCSGGELTAEAVKILPVIERLKAFETICGAIAYAHQAGVIHRDIKPGNIFLESLDSFIPIVGDFGLCYLKSDDPKERPTENESIGNWEFGPPQGHMGRQESPNESFDVYNLGKLLYWFLSGGVRLYREYFENAQYDLRNDHDHVIRRSYDVLRKSITEEESSRYTTAVEMLADVRELVMFAESEGKYLDCKLVQKCVFCRIGNYQWRFIPAVYYDNSLLREAFNYKKSRFYGLTFELDEHDTNVDTHPRILFASCDRCGNLQQFRLDKEFKLSSSWENLPEP